MKFLGHIINQEGIHADPEKTRAIKEFAEPRERKDLQRFFGMVNYLGKFSPSLADGSYALRQLLQKKADWIWGPDQIRQFVQLKEILTQPPTLTPYQLGKDVLLSTDASSYGLEAAILQEMDGVWKPVEFASRSLNTAEMRYVQIDKEALAICWACEKFHYYLGGRKFKVETDHNH